MAAGSPPSRESRANPRRRQVAEAVPQAPSPMPWVLACVGLTAAVALAVFAFTRSNADPAAGSEIARLRSNLGDLEKQLTALKTQAPPGGAEAQTRVRELEGENAGLREAIGRLESSEKELRRRLEALPQPPAPAPSKASPAPKNPEAADPVVDGAAPYLVDISAGPGPGGLGTRSIGLVVHTRFVVTRFKGIRATQGYTVEYPTETGRTACPASLYAVDPANDLALLQVQPMQSLKVPKLDSKSTGVDGQSVYAVLRKPVAGRVEYEKKTGKIRQTSVLINGILCLDVTFPFGINTVGAPLVSESGSLVGLIIATPGSAPDTVAAIPITRIIDLLERRDDPVFRVKGSVDEHELSSSMRFDYDREAAFHVGTDITHMVLQRETGQLLCLEPKQNGVIVVTLADRKVGKNLFTGTDPTCLAPTPGQRMFWVSNSASKNFVRIDPGQAQHVDQTIPVTFAPRRFVATTGALFAESSMSGNLYVITLSDRKEHQLTSFLGTSHTLNPKTGRLVGFMGNQSVSADADKVIGWAREFSRIKAEDGNGRQRLQREIEKAVSWHQPATSSGFFHSHGAQRAPFFDDAGKRLYCNTVVFEGNRLDAVVTAIKPATSTRYSEGALRALSSRYPGIQGALAASPDGKWFCTGLGLYSTETFAWHKDLTVPTALAVFAADSRTVYLYDSWNGYVVPMKVE